MSFLSPANLWFALLLIVPLVLYLLPLPRRRIVTSALYLWQRFLKTEAFGQASERMRRALGFALLAASLACLVLAAAELTLGRSAIKAQAVILLIDNSASMNASAASDSNGRQAGLSNLDLAKAAAAETLAAIDSSSQVIVAELAGSTPSGSAGVGVVRPAGPPDGQANQAIARIQPTDCAGNLEEALSRAYQLFGGIEAAELYVFSDCPLPPAQKNPWGARAHSWSAPKAGDNAAITALSAERSGQDIAIDFTLANYGQSSQAISGKIICNGQVRGSFERVELPAGQSAQRSVHLSEPAAAAIEVCLDGPAGKAWEDALASDNSAFVQAPACDDLKVAIAWPDVNKRNPFVHAVMTAMQEQGVCSDVLETTAASTQPASQPPSSTAVASRPAAVQTAVTVYVNHVPRQWDDSHAIVLYPLKGGAMDVAGLHGETATVSRQVSNSRLLENVDLRGLQVKGAVLAPVPAWADALVWADDIPVVWAGQTGKTKVLFVGIPVLPSGSRLPVVASFPALMRNTLAWMLPSARAEQANGQQRRCGLAKDSSGLACGFNVLSGSESDLRRADEIVQKNASPARRHSAAMALVILAAVLLGIEWTLFHRRLTE